MLNSIGNGDQIAGAQGSTEGAQTDADRATPDGKNVLKRAEEWVNDTAQRVARDTLDVYVHAANYAVGVYLNGAGFSREDTLRIAGSFAHSMSSNAGDPDQSEWWINGWDDAHKGNLPKKPE